MCPHGYRSESKTDLADDGKDGQSTRMTSLVVGGPNVK